MISVSVTIWQIWAAAMREANWLREDAEALNDKARLESFSI